MRRRRVMYNMLYWRWWNRFRVKIFGEFLVLNRRWWWWRRESGQHKTTSSDMPSVFEFHWQIKFLPGQIWMNRIFF